MGCAGELILFLFYVPSIENMFPKLMMKKAVIGCEEAFVQIG